MSSSFHGIGSKRAYATDQRPLLRTKFDLPIDTTLLFSPSTLYVIE